MKRNENRPRGYNHLLGFADPAPPVDMAYKLTSFRDIKPGIDERIKNKYNQKIALLQ